MVTLETIRQALQCDNPSCACRKPNGNVHCPAHEDTTPSLSVTEQDGKILVHCHGHCDKGRVIEELKARNLWSSRNSDSADLPRIKPRIVATYAYHDFTGKLLFQVCRLEPKSFRQRRPDGAGGWIWDMKGVGRVPYRLPEVLKANTVFVVEGEKDADSLAALGLTATTNAGGAGKWLKRYNPSFKDKAVVILPDNDEMGGKHAPDVARNLHGVAASVKIVELPGLLEKGDVSDWLKAGGTVEQLQALVEAAPEWEPGPDKDVPAQEEGKSKPTQAEILIGLTADAELFHDLNFKGFATIEVDGHRETWPVRTKGFKSWLLRRFFQATGKAPGAQALQDALGVLEAQAHFDGQGHEVYVRVAHTGGKIYVDLANDDWQAVEIAPQGWKVVDRPPVKFRRPRGLAPMSEPKPGGTLDDLKPFVNCKSGDWPLVVAWLIGSFSPGPYPAMIFQGEQGTAKTTTARTLKNMVDPGHTPQRTAPRDERDLMISASNSWCLSFDNLSDLKAWLSDGFCRLATGGGLCTRELYSDSDETILDAMRPIILNGIDSLVSRADLADRAILLELPRIQGHFRRREADLWQAFGAAQPGIMGAVFDALSAALANFHKVKLARLPRMADFAIWVVAAEPALPWEPGTFLNAYTRNRAAVVEHNLEGDVVAVAVRSFMEHRQEWEGTPTELLNELTDVAGDMVSRGKAWPKASNSLSNRLRRAATFLRASGIEIERAKSGSKNRTITIFRAEGAKDRPDRPDRPFYCDYNELKGDDKGDGLEKRDDPTVPGDDPQKRPSPRKATSGKGGDDGDDGDDKIPTQSKNEALSEVEL